MQTLRGVLTISLSLTVLQTRAADLARPDLGVMIRNLPDSLRTTTSAPRTHGWGASAQSPAMLVDVYRQDESVAASSVISDPKFQTELLTKFEGDHRPEGQMKMGRIDGQNGLIIFGAYRIRRSVAHYYCHIYALVERHPVRLAVDAFAVSRPADFDHAVNAMLQTTFGPATRQPVSTAYAAEHPQPLPPHFAISSVPYTEHALKVGDEGTVDVEFTIDHDGSIRHFKQTYTDRPLLGEGIYGFLDALCSGLPPTGTFRRK